jgi:hypothetical protein
VFKDLPVPALQRLCTSATELSFEKGAIVHTEESAVTSSWQFCIIITGVLRLIAKGEGKKRQLRAELSYFSTFEMVGKFSEARADSKMRISCIPVGVMMEVLGTAGIAALKEVVERSKCKGKRLEVPKSLFEVTGNFHLPTQPDPTRFAFEHPTALLGQFGYVGQFRDTSSQKICSIKVIAKARSAHLRMDGRMLQERNLLAAVYADCPAGLGQAAETWVPIPLGVMQDARKAYVSVTAIRALLPLLSPCMHIVFFLCDLRRPVSACHASTSIGHPFRCLFATFVMPLLLSVATLLHTSFSASHNTVPRAADIQGPVRLRPVRSSLWRRNRSRGQAVLRSEPVCRPALYP